jgi:hypothetical protein
LPQGNIAHGGPHLYVHSMVRISTTASAFNAIADTLPLGSVGFEREPTEGGMRMIWLERAVVDRLRTMRQRGEDISDTIVRLAALESRA